MNREFYVNVAELMVKCLPRPRRKLMDSTGDVLPLVTVECGLWSTITWV